MEIEWVYNDQVVIYKIKTFSRDSIYQNSEAIKHILRNWTAGKPYLALLDYTENPHMTLTPYYRQRTEDLLRTFPRLYGRTAYVMKKSAASQAFRLYVKYGIGHSHHRLKRELFFSCEEALAWLSEDLAAASVG